MAHEDTMPNSLPLLSKEIPAGMHSNERKMLRILSVAEVPPNPNAGASGTIVFTNRALKELGHCVDEVWSDDLGRRRVTHGNLHSLLEQPAMIRRAVLHRIQETPFDVVVSHQPQSYSAARAVRRAGWTGRFVVVSQGVENRIAPILAKWHSELKVPQSRSKFAFLSPLLQKALSRQWPAAAEWSDGFVVTNREDQQFLESNYGIDQARTHVWASGLPDAFLSTPCPPMTPERLDRILYVGQFAFYKSPQLLARIASEVLRANPRATMTWICHESHHGAARALMCPTIRNRIVLSGWIKHEDLANAFDSHGIFIFPTIAEGFGRVALEAMSRGLCVVSSNCCAMKDYIANGVNGSLCEVGDVQAFAAEALRLQSSPRDAAQISSAAIAMCKAFTWSNVASDLADFLCRITQAPVRRL